MPKLPCNRWKVAKPVPLTDPLVPLITTLAQITLDDYFAEFQMPKDEHDEPPAAWRAFPFAGASR
jgi:hypothetical protein